MKDTLLQKADTIRTERRAGGNTASRVGGLLSDLITWVFGELQLRPSHQQLSELNHALTTLIGSKVGTDVVQALTTVSDRLNGEVARLNEVIVNLGIKRTPDDFYQSVFNHPTFKGMTTSIYVATIAESSSRGVTFILKNAGQRWVTLYLFENYYIKKMVVEYADKTREVEQWRSGWREFLARRMEWKADTRTLRLHNNDGHSGTHSDVQIPLADSSQAGLMSVEDKSFIQEVRVALGPQKDGGFAALGAIDSQNSKYYTPRWEKVRTVRENNMITGYFDSHPLETGDWICLRGQQNSMKWRFTFNTTDGPVVVEFDPSSQHNACIITSDAAHAYAVTADDYNDNTPAQYWILRRFPPHPENPNLDSL